MATVINALSKSLHETPSKTSYAKGKEQENRRCACSFLLTSRSVTSSKRDPASKGSSAAAQLSNDDNSIGAGYTDRIERQFCRIKHRIYWSLRDNTQRMSQDCLDGNADTDWTGPHYRRFGLSKKKACACMRFRTAITVKRCLASLWGSLGVVLA